MGDVLAMLGSAAASPWAFWLAGLVASFRLIAPAEGFLSRRSADWLARQVLGTQGGSARRRFDVAFKRYVDRTFEARQVRLGRCRIWRLSFWRCATVSFLTFFALFWAMVLASDTAAMQAAFVIETRGTMERLAAAGMISFSSAVLNDPGAMGTVFWASLLVFALVGAVANVVPDYLSFIETRNVLARMGRGAARDVMLLLVDALLTGAIATLGYFTVTLLMTLLGEGIGAGGARSADPVHTLLIALVLLGQSFSALFGAVTGQVFETGLVAVGVHAMVLSTFATSVWIWVFFAGTTLLRLGVLLGPLLRAVRLLVDVEAHPFRAAWLMFAALWTAGMGAAALIGWGSA